MKKLKLKTKMLLLFISIFVVLATILTCITLGLYSNFLKTKTQDVYKSSLELIIENVNNYFEEITKTIYVTCYNDFAQGFLTRLYDYEKYTYYEDSRQFLNTIKNIEYIQSGIRIMFFSETHEKIYHNFYASFNNSYDFKDEDWYDDIQNPNLTQIVITENEQLYLMPSDRKSNETYGVVYKILNHLDSSVIGYAYIQIDKKNVTSLLLNDKVICENLLIYDKNQGNIIFDNKEDSTRWDQTLANILDDEQIIHNTINTNVGDEEGITIYNTLSNLGWIFILNSSYSFLLTGLPFLLFSCIITTFFMILLCVFITIKFTYKLTSPIEKLNQGFNRVKANDFNFKIPVQSEDEIGALTTNFNVMLEEIDFFVNKSKSMHLLLKQAELDALQQQINPHFLYNTLEMIIGMASCNHNQDVINSCELLGNIFKFNLLNRDFVTVADELNHIKNYINITQLRFPNKFVVDFDIDECLLDKTIMKFTLQPFVENAIIHGFSDMVTHGVITVSIRRKEENFIIAISDNGKGFSEEILKELGYQILKFNGENDEKIMLNSHIGVLNVILRLKLYFNNNIKYEIKNLAQGSQISFEFPINFTKGDAQ